MEKKEVIDLPQKVFVSINAGSSSLKFTLFSLSLKRVFEAHFSQINTNHPKLTFEHHALPFQKSVTIPEAIEIIFKLLKEKYQFSENSIKGIGHRFVHGGSLYHSSVVITPAILKNLKKLNHLAPLHNPPSLLGIQTCLKLTDATQVVVFDTAFHSHMLEVASSYAIPAKYQIKRYGFHGISHHFMWQKFVEVTKKKRAHIITLHLGNGCSMAAISNGISLDTSMGFTPLEGLVMATRSGDIDPSVVQFLCDTKKMTVKEAIEVLNYHSGLLGVSQHSSDMKTLVDLYHKDKQAAFAIDLFCYRILKYIGAYVAVLGSIDGLVFSGGIGENSPFIRKKIAEKLTWLNVFVDQKKNQQSIQMSEIVPIHTKKSLPIFVVGADENQYIAKEIKKCVR